MTQVEEPSIGNDKLVWVVIILFAQVRGAALYLFVRRPRRLAWVITGSQGAGASIMRELACPKARSGELSTTSLMDRGVAKPPRGRGFWFLSS